MKNIDINKDNLENIDIVINIDKTILENIDIGIDISIRTILKISISISISLGTFLVKKFSSADLRLFACFFGEISILTVDISAFF